ncbi:MAG: hypothetical protein U0003_03375 [Vampirovibrionales bacterium]
MPSSALTPPRYTAITTLVQSAPTSVEKTAVALAPTPTKPATIKPTQKTASKPNSKPVAKISTPLVKKPAAVATQPTPKTQAPSVTSKPVSASTASFWAFSAELKQQPLLRIPITLPQSSSEPSLAETYTTAQDVLNHLQQAKTPSAHVEILRRAANSLPQGQYAALITGVNQRFDALPDNPQRQFDWGYTKLVFQHNKAGLFYLRKANDQMAHPITALTYALAQAAVDTLIEKAPASELSIRKLDVQHKLDDALALHGQKPIGGFWPTYQQTLNALAHTSAYADWVATDRTETLLPSGHSVEVAYSFAAISGGAATVNTSPTLPPSVANTCQRSVWNTQTHPAKNALKTLSFSVGTLPVTGYVFQPGSVESPPTLLITSGQQLLANITHSRVPYVLEDTDDDTIPELVIRQFLTSANTPNMPPQVASVPLMVYRYNGCQYENDRAIAALFE